VMDALYRGLLVVSERRVSRQVATFEDERVVFEVRQVPEAPAVLVILHPEAQRFHGSNQVCICNAPLPHIVNVPPRSAVLGVRFVQFLEELSIRGIRGLRRRVTEVLLLS